MWMRARRASRIASQQRSTSAAAVRERPQMTGPLTPRAMACTDSKSPWLATGKPASITSTPRRASCSAISSFSPWSSEMPGDCSPSRRVVSKMITWPGSVWSDMAGAFRNVEAGWAVGGGRSGAGRGRAPKPTPEKRRNLLARGGAGGFGEHLCGVLASGKEKLGGQQGVRHAVPMSHGNPRPSIPGVSAELDGVDRRDAVLGPQPLHHRIGHGCDVANTCSADAPDGDWPTCMSAMLMPASARALADPADHARPVVVAHHQHVGRRGQVDRVVVDHHHARLAA